jgi:hypothetical protein
LIFEIDPTALALGPSNQQLDLLYQEIALEMAVCLDEILYFVLDDLRFDFELTLMLRLVGVQRHLKRLWCP